MIPCVTFTHSGGALRIPWWVEGVVAVGMVPVVCDDAADPLPPTTRGWLAAAGVEYRQTKFPRRGNLNGTDTAAGICLELADAARRHGWTHAVKCDDDTVILDAAIFADLAFAAAVGLTWKGDRRGGAYGMAYALRGDVAASVALHLAGLPIDTAAPEDLTVWAAVRGIAGDAEMLSHEFDPEGGPFAALPHWADVREAVGRFGVLTVGNPPQEGWRDRGRQTAERLRKVVCTARAMGVQRAG